MKPKENKDEYDVVTYIDSLGGQTAKNSQDLRYKCTLKAGTILYHNSDLGKGAKFEEDVKKPFFVTPDVMQAIGHAKGRKNAENAELYIFQVVADIPELAYFIKNEYHT